jgi:hypothetical protein
MFKFTIYRDSTPLASYRVLFGALTSKTIKATMAAYKGIYPNSLIWIDHKRVTLPEEAINNAK